MTFLADTFRDLANDPSWPTGGACWEHKLDKAWLALMLVEERINLHHGYNRTQHPAAVPADSIAYVLQQFNINPSHYANVKKRVEQADTEEK